MRSPHCRLYGLALSWAASLALGACSAGGDATAPDLSLLDDHALFRGTLEARCANGNKYIGAWFWDVQLELARTDDALSGRAWVLDEFDEPALPVRGRVEQAGGALDTLHLGRASAADALGELEVSELHAEEGALVGEISGTLRTLVDDVEQQCVARGSLRLEPDESPPVCELVGSPIMADPVEVRCDEPVRVALLQVGVTTDYGPLRVETKPVAPANAESSRSFLITPESDWPSGSAQLALFAVSDVGGHRASVIPLTLTIPHYASVTSDASLENSPFSADGTPWFGCLRTTKVSYDFAGEARTLEPVDGTSMAACPSGTQLRGYVVPPDDARALLIDAAELDASTGARTDDLTLALVRSGVSTPLELAVPDDLSLPPAFATHRVSIDPAEGPFWLVVQYDGPVAEDGSPHGLALVDYLRFE